MKLNTKKDISIKYTDVPVAQTVVQLCEIKNIKNIVICSGSRNAPLTNSFVENPFFLQKNNVWILRINFFVEHFFLDRSFVQKSMCAP